MPLSRRTAGWRTTEEKPPICPSYPPDTQPKAWTTQDYREQITPCLDTYFTQEKPHYGLPDGSRVSPPVSSPHPLLYNFPRLRVHGLLLPLKPSHPAVTSAFSSLSCCFCSFQPSCSQIGATFSGLSRTLLTVTPRLSFSECHNPRKASALHSSVSPPPPINKKKKGRKKKSAFWWQN